MPRTYSQTMPDTVVGSGADVNACSTVLAPGRLVVTDEVGQPDVQNVSDPFGRVPRRGLLAVEDARQRLAADRPARPRKTACELGDRHPELLAAHVNALHRLPQIGV